MGLPNTLGSYHPNRESFHPASLPTYFRKTSIFTDRGMELDYLLCVVGIYGRPNEHAYVPAILSNLDA